jgi:hypothetical protein
VRRRLLLVAAAAAAFAVAAVAALLAVSVGSVERDLAAGDVRYGLDPAGGEEWPVGSRPHDRIAVDLLGLEDDLDARRALAAFARTREDVGVTGIRQTRARGEAQAALARVERRTGDPALASRAATMLGILAYEDAVPTPGRTTTPVERSLAEFALAIRLDPTNTLAKRNLELVLRINEAGGLRPGDVVTPPEAGGQGASGASLSPPGSGY